MHGGTCLGCGGQCIPAVCPFSPMDVMGVSHLCIRKDRRKGTEAPEAGGSAFLEAPRTCWSVCGGVGRGAASQGFLKAGAPPSGVAVPLSYLFPSPDPEAALAGQEGLWAVHSAFILVLPVILHQ